MSAPGQHARDCLDLANVLELLTRLGRISSDVGAEWRDLLHAPDNCSIRHADDYSFGREARAHVARPARRSSCQVRSGQVMGAFLAVARREITLRGTLYRTTHAAISLPCPAPGSGGAAIGPRISSVQCTTSSRPSRCSTTAVQLSTQSPQLT